MRGKLEYLNQYIGKNTPIAHRSAIRAFLKVSLKVQICRFEHLEPYAEKYLNEKRSHISFKDLSNKY